MCSTLVVYATDADNYIRKDIPAVIWPSPEHFTPEKPTCTCHIANPDGDGKTLRHTFADEVLAGFFNQVGYGNIVIEVR